MGAVSCRQGQHTQVTAPHKGGNIQGPWVRGWKSLWSDMGTIRSGLEELWQLQEHQCLHQKPLEATSLLVEKPLSEWPVPQFISLFLPEFPMRPIRGQQQLKILGLVAKGSFGTVLKVLDCAQKAVFAVKVVPKIKVLQRDTLRQCKEEVSIQRQINHPFVHSLGDSWQGKRHLFIMCSYCSTDLYSLWSAVGCFPESSIRLFAAELVLVLCYLHDLGIIHRDVKLLCQNPLHRLRYLHQFQVHSFFRGVTFDPELLQKQPVDFVMETQDTQPSPLESKLFKDFDCDLESFLVYSIPA
ncbi:putative serine/threonine-protein kinase [Sciurus carolinensis]|uniref:Serine/threonine-protein kinase n=1 Tax=Sciurus carolinensis TaxID=30640 RepID=A0AA41N681_SCICA|nr:putative serine/threonine-protein kinase [Sciurus carolinensis]